VEFVLNRDQSKGMALFERRPSSGWASPQIDVPAS